ncbi:maleylpyruvate isomerase family mycothiol-dependent enzyme [Saccharomonospora azurea]|uniref:maleylpyruvate isomerase family mycothiol-dependent enzyme n=1 Tax=Saccharomonospora azurea TaxID=40988 RepID=UPI00056AF09D|nr:maleylpyruvate isomerase family mycothiol-dependent enzyme [Saccharomonospora azurea]
MRVTEWIDAIDDAGRRLASAARAAGWEAEVPSCPGWRVRDLVLHVGGVHRWARTFVETGRRRPLALAEPQDIAPTPAADGELLDWFGDGRDALVAALRAAPSDLECWTFLRAASPLEHWARRQAHETTVHRLDAELAAGAPGPVDPALAADGVDELLGAFGVRSLRRRSHHADLLRVEAVDVGERWTLTFHGERAHVARSPLADAPPHSGGACVRGTAEQLYSALWNRTPLASLHVEGDAGMVDDWPRLLRVRWR